MLSIFKFHRMTFEGHDSVDINSSSLKGFFLLDHLFSQNIAATDVVNAIIDIFEMNGNICES